MFITNSIIMGKYYIGLFAGFAVAVSFGYIANVVKVFNTDFASPYKAEVIRLVGVVVPPVGIVAGYLTIED